jgi:predicted metal-dependent hydrolase
MTDPKRRLKPEQVRVTYRKMSFAFESKGFDKRWHDGSAFISYFWAALSMAFPSGERFFMDAVSSVEARIDDPELLEEISEFVRQEGHHSFQHRKFNRMVGDLGFNVALYEGRFARALQWAADNLRPMQKLAVTVALEHFTATLSREWLDDPELGRGADPNVRALWAWHFAEEIEHKATCFDVYERLGGPERTRIRALRRAWLLILAITFQNLLSMLREDGRLLDVRDHVRGLWYLFGPRGLLTKMVPSLLAYCRPDFHPWQANDARAIANWQKDNAHYIKSMRRVSKPLGSRAA